MFGVIQTQLGDLIAGVIERAACLATSGGFGICSSGLSEVAVASAVVSGPGRAKQRFVINVFFIKRDMITKIQLL